MIGIRASWECLYAGLRVAAYSLDNIAEPLSRYSYISVTEKLVNNHRLPGAGSFSFMDDLFQIIHFE